MVFDQDPVQLGGAVDQSAQVHADQSEMGRGLVGGSEFTVGNHLAVKSNLSLA